jgi:hypothetical protein
MDIKQLIEDYQGRINDLNLLLEDNPNLVDWIDKGNKVEF